MEQIFKRRPILKLQLLKIINVLFTVFIKNPNLS